MTTDRILELGAIAADLEREFKAAAAAITHFAEDCGD
jgi:hypothetical protein